MGSTNDFIAAFEIAQEIKKANNLLIEINCDQKGKEDNLFFENLKELEIYDYSQGYRYFVCHVNVNKGSKKGEKSEFVFLKKHLEMPIYEIFTESGVQIENHDNITNELIDIKVRSINQTNFKHTKNKETIHFLQKMIITFAILLLALSLLDFVVTSFTTFELFILQVNDFTQLGIVGILISGILGLLDCIDYVYKNYLKMSRIFLGRALMILAIIYTLIIVPVIFLPNEIVFYENGFIFVSILFLVGSLLFRLEKNK